MPQITRADVRKLLQAIEATGDRNETARRCGQLIHSVFEYAMDNHDEHVTQNPAASRKNWLRSKDEEHRAGITDPKKFGVFMSLLDTGWALNRGPTVQNAIRFLARTFVRQEALCGAQWSEMHNLKDPDNAEWRIPAARMKGPIGKRRPFTVPLSRQAVAILTEQHQVSKHSPFVFPHAVRAARGMSKGAMKAAIGNMGYTPEEQTPHGFRTTFETLAQERPISASLDIVRRCMAHKISDAVRAAYDRSDRYEERRELMQKWADYIDELKAKASE